MILGQSRPIDVIAILLHQFQFVRLRWLKGNTSWGKLIFTTYQILKITVCIRILFIIIFVMCEINL